jgi:hypothetical protein
VSVHVVGFCFGILPVNILLTVSRSLGPKDDLWFVASRANCQVSLLSKRLTIYIKTIDNDQSNKCFKAYIHPWSKGVTRSPLHCHLSLVVTLIVSSSQVFNAEKVVLILPSTEESKKCVFSCQNR